MTAPLLTRLLCACVLSALVFGPATSGAQETPPSEDAISYRPSYRSERAWWSPQVRDGRAIIDQMQANDGVDDTLRDFGWDDLELNAAYAANAIKKKDETRFKEYVREIERSQGRMESRAATIQGVRDKINKDLAQGTARWNTLMAGDDEILNYIGEALGIKAVGITMSATLQWVGKRIDSRLLRGGGKALGPISSALAVIRLAEAYDEKVEMELMLGQLLELTELQAYLDVLLKKYDGVLGAQDEILNGLLREFHRCD